MEIISKASAVADENNGRLNFDQIIMCIQQVAKQQQTQTRPEEGPDPKVLQFLMILEEYRIKCEEEGAYLEASRAHKQLGILRKQEEKRQQKVIQARHVSERQDVQLAHNLQYQEFNKAWDKYLEEYDAMAQMYIQQMTERHALVLLEFQKQLREELANKPPKWSRALLDQRRKQHINARNKNYVMAQKLKKISDRNEEKERQQMEEEQALIFARREAKFRQQQQTELQALLKRIECRRKEHIKQRELDTKRLLQRNRNVQAVLETKQNAECQKLFAEIKKVLYSNSILYGGNYQKRSSALEQTHSASQSLNGSGIVGSKKSASPTNMSAGSQSHHSFPLRESNSAPSYKDYIGGPGGSGSGSGFNLPSKAQDHAILGQPIEMPAEGKDDGYYGDTMGSTGGSNGEDGRFNNMLYAEDSFEDGSSLEEYKNANNLN